MKKIHHARQDRQALRGRTSCQDQGRNARNLIQMDAFEKSCHDACVQGQKKDELKTKEQCGTQEPNKKQGLHPGHARFLEIFTSTAETCDQDPEHKGAIE